MAVDILTSVHDKYRSFSKGQKSIANYLLESYDKAAFMTANKLGKTVNVSESTVVRFAVELGFEGYPEMQKSLQELVRTKLTSVQRIEVSHTHIGSQDVLGSVIQADIDALRLTSESLNRAQMDAAVDAILNAKHIYIVGVRSSATIASFLNFYFRNIFDNVHLIEPTAVSEMFEQMLRLSSDDVVIGISLPRYSSRTVKIMQFAKKCGATTVAITDKREAPAGRFADIVLESKSDMVSIVDSLVAPMSVVNALIVMVGRKQEQKLSDSYEKLDRLWEEFDAYEHVE